MCTSAGGKISPLRPLTGTCLSPPPRSVPTIDKVLGNVSGLRSAQLKSLGNLYRRRLAPGTVTTPELARNLSELSHEIRREISLLIDRRGRVLSVSVADAKAAELPDRKSVV